MRHGTSPESRTQQIYVISVVPTTGWLVKHGSGTRIRTQIRRFKVFCPEPLDDSAMGWPVGFEPTYLDSQSSASTDLASVTIGGEPDSCLPATRLGDYKVNTCNKALNQPFLSIGEHSVLEDPCWVAAVQPLAHQFTFPVVQ